MSLPYHPVLLLIALFVLSVQMVEMRVILLHISGMEILGALTVDGSSWVCRVPLSRTAAPIEYRAATLLFNTGLECDIDTQFRADTPWWAAPLSAYQRVILARDQLNAASTRVDHILLSHAHWNHASGLIGFSEVPAWALYGEIAFNCITTPPVAFPNQFRHGVC